MNDHGHHCRIRLATGNGFAYIIYKRVGQVGEYKCWAGLDRSGNAILVPVERAAHAGGGCEINKRIACAVGGVVTGYRCRCCCGIVNRNERARSCTAVGIFHKRLVVASGQPRKIAGKLRGSSTVDAEGQGTKPAEAVRVMVPSSAPQEVMSVPDCVSMLGVGLITMVTVVESDTQLPKDSVTW